MDNKSVRLGLGCLRGVASLALGALLLTGCHSTPKPDYVNIPELPSTPIGTPVASTPAPPDSAPAVSAPPSDVSSPATTPALSAPAPELSTAAGSGDSTSAPVSTSSVATTQVTTPSTTNTQAAKGTQKHAPPATPELKSNDLIRAGEMIHIVFSDTPLPIPPVDDKVKDDGTITLMYNETFHAADKTPNDLNQEIRKRYVPGYFAQLTASVNRDIMRVYYVDGEVRNPSKQPYTGPITVTQAIASAGGFTDFADKTGVMLIRANGKVETVNCKKAIRNPKLDPEVYPGDKVHVKRSIFG